MLAVLFFVFIVKVIIAAGDATCGVVPISVWDDSPLKRTETLPGPVNIVVIQHTATPQCTDDGQCKRMVAAIRKYHIKELGLTDIGASFLIGGNGKVYEGAGWKYVGAHTRGYNKRSIGMSFIGDFRSSLPTESAQKALHDLIACGVENKYIAAEYHLVAHSQLSDTQSPGEMLRNKVETWPQWLSNPKEILN